MTGNKQMKSTSSVSLHTLFLKHLKKLCYITEKLSEMDFVVGRPKLYKPVNFTLFFVSYDIALDFVVC
jgi:hypothetical protein